MDNSVFYLCYNRQYQINKSKNNQMKESQKTFLAVVTIFIFVVILAIFIKYNKKLDIQQEPIYIGHLYEKEKNGSRYDDNDENNILLARPLFKKTTDGWQAFPHDLEVSKRFGNTPGELASEVSLFPKQITWYLFNAQENIQTFVAQKPSEYKSLSDVGSSPVNNLILPNIEPNVEGWLGRRREFLISTKRDINFYNFTEKTGDINQFKSYVENIPEVKNLYKLEGTNDPESQDTIQLDKNVKIYTFKNKEEMAIVEFYLSNSWFDDFGILLVKDENNKWRRVFTSSSVDKDHDSITFSLKYVADFDGDGIKEYMLSLSGYDYDGYALYQEGMLNPVVYYWIYH